MFFFVFSSVVVVVLLAGILLLSDSCRTHARTTRPHDATCETFSRCHRPSSVDGMRDEIRFWKEKKQMRCRFVNHLRVLFSPIKTMHATYNHKQRALFSLSLFSQNTLYSSIEGTENNREEDVSLPRAMMCALYTVL